MHLINEPTSLDEERSSPAVMLYQHVAYRGQYETPDSRSANRDACRQSAPTFEVESSGYYGRDVDHTGSYSTWDNKVRRDTNRKLETPSDRADNLFHSPKTP